MHRIPSSILDEFGCEELIDAALRRNQSLPKSVDGKTFKIDVTIYLKSGNAIKGYMESKTDNSREVFSRLFSKEDFLEVISEIKKKQAHTVIFKDSIEAIQLS